MNLIGIRWFARANNAIVTWKIGVIILVIVAFLVTQFRGANFSDFGGFAPYGLNGIFSAISTAGIVFELPRISAKGVELAGETDNPSATCPLP